MFSRLKFKSNKGNFLHANKLYLTKQYYPKVILEDGENLTESIEFLSSEYFENKIEKYFLLVSGLQEDFVFSHSTLNRNSIPLHYLEKFEANSNYIVENAKQYGYQHRLINHISLNLQNLLQNYKYADIFWSEVTKTEDNDFARSLFQKTTYKMTFGSVTLHNYVVDYILNNSTFPNRDNQLVKPSELYAYKLEKYLSDPKKLPKFDLSNIIDNETNCSLENLLGIKQVLSDNECISLLCQDNVNLSLSELEDIQLVNTLKSYFPNNEEKRDLKLLNQHLEWVSVFELCVLEDETYEVNQKNVIHDVFLPLKNNFEILEISYKSIDVLISPDTPLINNEIEDFLLKTGKYISFKIDQKNYLSLEENIHKRIQQVKFYEVDSITREFKNEHFRKFKDEIIFYKNDHDETVFYTGFWKQNKDLIDFLFGMINHDGLPKPWLKNTIQRWDENEIIQKLEDEFGELPKEFTLKNKLEQGHEPNSNFFNEVLDYIETMREVEDIYDESKIEDLKSIAQNFKDHPEERRKSLNLLAKLKLCKKKGIEYDKSWSFNQVLNGNEKYFIHSARGAFAYIHPNELIRMRDEGFKMAIDFGTKEIRVFDTLFEILQMHQNYLILYQGNPDEEKIMDICEENFSAEKFHFLLVDKEKQTDEAMVIRNLIGRESYD